MPFQKGKPKTGGRAKGTPNKDNPLKVLLHEHSVDYFSKSIKAEDISPSVFIIDPKADSAMSIARVIKEEFVEQHKGELFSQYEVDCISMRASDRAKAEIELLSYHTPKMQAISADMNVKDANKGLTDRLTRLASGEEIAADE
jgi:hypothetical protein